jgi:hypothetical protein
MRSQDYGQAERGAGLVDVKTLDHLVVGQMALCRLQSEAGYENHQ